MWKCGKEMLEGLSHIPTDLFLFIIYIIFWLIMGEWRKPVNSPYNMITNKLTIKLLTVIE